MSNNNKIRNVKDTTIECINWIEEAIYKGYIRNYEHESFSNIQKVGAGGFGKVYRAKWKNSEQYLALKSFFNIDNVTSKEIVHELRLQRDVQFHDNVIKFYGIAKFDPENQNNQSKDYLLVMEYANSGTLKDYLKKNFKNLTWNDKYKMAHQLSCAVLCLHNEEIVHRDLHSGNVLINQNIVKLSDFGLSKRIETSYNTQSKTFGIIPYVDPKKFVGGQRKNLSLAQMHSLNEKSDVYSIGVLLWEISSGYSPFEGEQYDVNLALKISQGRRENPVPDTPKDYIKIYTECWDGEPDKRPIMNQVVKRLEAKPNITTENCQTGSNHQPTLVNKQKFNQTNTSCNLSHGDLQLMPNFNIEDFQTGLNPQSISVNEQKYNQTNMGISSNTYNPELSRIIQNFNEMNPIFPNKDISSEKSENNFIIYDHKSRAKTVGIFPLFQDESEISEKNSSIIVNDIVRYIYKMDYEGKDSTKRKNVLDYIESNNINSQNIYQWLVNNQINRWLVNYQKNSNSMFLLGYFRFLGIGTYENSRHAFESFLDASEQNHTLAQYYVGMCYENGQGTTKNESLAFRYCEKVANEGHSFGMARIGYYYDKGIGTNVNKQKAFKSFQKAANLGHSAAQYSLARMYKYGEGTDKNFNKAFELFKQSAEGGFLGGIVNLAYCYDRGVGTSVDKQKAFELYQKAADLGNSIAQYCLGVMYEKRIGIEKEINKDMSIY